MLCKLNLNFYTLSTPKDEVNKTLQDASDLKASHSIVQAHLVQVLAHSRSHPLVSTLKLSHRVLRILFVLILCLPLALSGNTQL